MCCRGLIFFILFYSFHSWAKPEIGVVSGSGGRDRGGGVEGGSHSQGKIDENLLVMSVYVKVMQT